MYRVETERLVRQIAADGYKAVRLTDCQYVYHVERCPAEALTEDFFSGYRKRHCISTDWGVGIPV